MPFDIVQFFSRKREIVRLLKKREVIPATLEAGFDLLGQLDPDWVWVLETDGEITGVLVASPAHGVAMIWRIVVKEGSTMALGKLLRRFLKDSRARGIRGYLAILSGDREAETRLAKIVTHAGGRLIKDQMSMYASPMPRSNI